MFGPRFLPVAPIILCLFLLYFAYSLPQSKQAGLTKAQIDSVKAKLLEITTHRYDNHSLYTHPALSLAPSWELGTATEALLELDEPELSVYGESPFPPPYLLPKHSPIFTIANRCVFVSSNKQ